MAWRGKENKLLTMHRLSPTPFSSDEGPESGDDSEEDLVTNHLKNPPSNSQLWESGGQHIQYHVPLCHQQQPSVQPAHTHGGSGQPPRRLVRMAELPTVDSVTAETLGMGSNVSSIPSISITPHSPITQKPFTVLSESLRHLQSMQEKIRLMRETNAAANAKSGRALTRLSSSCPSLNVDGEEIEDDDLPSSWSDEFLLDERKTMCGITILEQNRRKSWAGLSDEEKKRARQRSVSLSSLDSDTEEPYFDAEDSGNTQEGFDGIDGGCWVQNDKRSLSGSSSPVAYKGRKNGGSSTHSLNEVHLDGKKVKRNRSEKPRLLTPRLTLQKSISTPSILAGVINQAVQKQANHIEHPHRNSYYLPHQDEQNHSEDGLPHHMLISRNVLPKKLLSNYQYDDENASSKPRKRASIFFRRKKDKSKRTSHQFVGVCYSNSATCDVCCKPMTNKPALRCESCLVCVHENSCKDQISDCSKLKNSKIAHKHNAGSVDGLSNATKSASLGSTPGSVFVTGFSGSRSAQPLMNIHGRSSISNSSSPTRPYTIVTLSGGVSSPVRRLSGFSQWRRVATKLGVNKVTTEDKDLHEGHPDVTDYNILEVNSASLESLEDPPETSPEPTIECIDSDPDLRLLEVEPDLWVKTVDQEIISKLTEKQIKKQEYIYELIMTEKNHCRTLKLIKTLFAEGMLKELGCKESLVKSVFPCLDELINIHFNFLWRLRERQRLNKYIAKIGDILLDQFSGENAQGLKEAYGIICAKQPDSIANYKDLQKTDRRFQAFIKQKSSHPLLKKKEVTERWVFTSQRCTKYPLGIAEMIKYTRDDPEEEETLKAALESIKEILRDINTQVHEKEMRQRLLEIYHKIDAKSYAMFRDQKFKKSDLLIDGRKLMFEGTAVLMQQQKGKELPLVVVVMSDLMFFLQENKEKYNFVTPDNKMGVIPLSNVYVRPNAGVEKGIMLLNEIENPEMYYLECTHPINRKNWIESITDAKDKCPEDDSALRRLQEGNTGRIHELIMSLQHYDKEIARVCEDKSKTVYELVSSLGGEIPNLLSPDYRSLLEEHNLDYESARDLQITMLNEALRSVSSACGWGTNLARSVSSVGEHQSDAYVSPSLPKRAETFGGFDNSNKDNRNLKQSGGKKKKESKVSLLSTDTAASDLAESLKNRRASGTSLSNKCSQDTLSMASTQSGESESSGAVQSQQQQLTLATQLVHCLNSALILSQHHFTQYEILRAKVSTGLSIEGRFSHSQKLEELRNIQEQISQERAIWTKEKDNQERWISEKQDQLKRLQETLKSQQEDINQQREDLYRKLEVLKNQGILLNPTLNVLTTSTTHTLPQQTNFVGRDPNSPNSSQGVLPIQVSPHTSPTGPSVPSQKSRSDLSKHRNSTASLVNFKRDSNPNLPTHLISAAKQQKSAGPVKQQIPMKLAKLGGAGSSSTSSSSSLSSSMSGSLGGSMSPSQETPSGVPRIPLNSPPSGSSSQQMIPLKLSKSSPTESSRTTRVVKGYQRLASPPPATVTDSTAAAHHRTESSPAMLQNTTPPHTPYGLPQPIHASATIGELSVSVGSKAARTHTYPKLANKPNLPNVARVTSSEASSVSSTIYYPVPKLPSNKTGPGQRMKDPDSDQDIIFF